MWGERGDTRHIKGQQGKWPTLVACLLIENTRAILNPYSPSTPLYVIAHYPPKFESSIRSTFAVAKPRCASRSMVTRSDNPPAN